MARNVDFDKILNINNSENVGVVEKEQPKYSNKFEVVDVNCGKITFNKALLATATFVLVGSSAVAAYSGCIMLASLILPNLTIYSTMVSAFYCAIGAVIAKASHKWRGDIKEKIAEDDEKAREELRQSYVKTR